MVSTLCRFIRSSAELRSAILGSTRNAADEDGEAGLSSLALPKEGARRDGRATLRGDFGAVYWFRLRLGFCCGVGGGVGVGVGEATGAGAVAADSAGVHGRLIASIRHTDSPLEISRSSWADVAGYFRIA